MNKIFNKKSLTYILLFFLLTFLQSHAQYEDESWKVYDDSEVAIIEITMDPNDLQFMYSDPFSDSMHVASVHFKNKHIDETIDSVGIRIRGKTSRTAEKKSFKLSFNTFVNDGEFYSLEKINLNGEHNDPTIMRSKICWDLYKDISMISTRASHAAVYINGDYYGLYISIEQIDEEFLEKNFNNDGGNLWKCLAPARLSYWGDNPESYKAINNDGVRIYDLKTNEYQDDYSDLAKFIDIINNIHDSIYIESLFQILSIDNVFKYFSNDILIGSWDDFWAGSNNYYLYFDNNENKFWFIPYDYDASLGRGVGWNTNWSTRDIYNWGFESAIYIFKQRMLDIPELRNLFTHYLEYYSENAYSLTNWESRADSVKDLITPFVEIDTYYERDWNFTNLDFHQSYDSTGYFLGDDLKINGSIKEFVNERNSSLLDQIEYLPSDPIIYKATINENVIFDNDSLTVKASIFSHTGLSNVKIEIRNNNTIVETIPMSFQPVENTNEISKKDRWKVKFLPIGSWIKGDLRIIAEDVDGRISTYPKDGIEIKKVIHDNGIIFINEIMSKNDSTIMDAANEYDDWVEIYNPNDTALVLSNMYLTDEKSNLTKWRIPEGTIIESNTYYLFWCDDDTIQGNSHTNFKLNSFGEFLAITDNDGITILDSISFPAIPNDISFGRNLNMDSFWHYFVFPTPNISNFIQPNEQTYEVVISEIMSTNTNVITDENGEFEDWIEIFNPQDTAVNLSGKFLTDNKNFLGKWRFPDNTIINSGEYLMVWCDNDSTKSSLHSNFQLSSNGEYLSLIDKDGVTIVDSVSFPMLSADNSFARREDIDRMWEVTSTSTPGFSNVITDIKSSTREFENNASVFPNPFNPTTTIQFELSKTTDLDIKIFDILGKQVWSKNNKMIEKGKHQLVWDGNDNYGNSLASGIYLLRIDGDAFNKMIKLVLLK
ncbi:MAG: T9SS type A sorting domain-containing protein [Ignavibacteriae bacterium]|nr:T9SS type A sorting domain-containing protein [Ignavibacteriota bacterium]